MNDDVSKKPGHKKPVKKQSAVPAEEDEPTFNTVLGPSEEASEDNETANTPGGISRQSAILLFLIATFTGAAIGWIGPNLFSGTSQKIGTLQTALEQAQSQLIEANRSQEELAGQVNALLAEDQNDDTSARAANNKIVKLEREIDALKSNTGSVDFSVELAALNDRISALSTFSGTETETSENTLVLVERLEALENNAEILQNLEERMTSLETADRTDAVATFPKPDENPIAIPNMETAQDRQHALQVLIDTFPRTKMLEAVKAQEAIASKKPSWLQRTLSRHVKVRDDNQADPAAMIDDAETALRQGDITQALKIIAQLNPPVRTIAADWTLAAKKAAKTIEKDL